MKREKQKVLRHSEQFYDISIPALLDKATKFAQIWKVDLSEVIVEAATEYDSGFFRLYCSSLETWDEVDARLKKEADWKEMRRKQFEQLKKEFGSV